ncbi:flavodoxin, partial [Vibrio sinaloensis]
IYSDPCTLYLAFKEGEPVGAAILTQVDNQFLVSDIVLTQNQTLANKHAFSLLLVNKLNVNLSEYSDFYLEI